MKISIVIVVVVAFITAGSCSPACDPSVRELANHAGFYSLPHSRAARMFYFFFESMSKKTDPLVLWLTGGPGCGSEIALLQENGPFWLSNMSLVRNRYSWNKASHMLYVDQPTGTGFSYSSNKNDTRHNEESVASDLYDFLQVFLKDHHQYARNRFYITGESYSGHYIPALASRIQMGNREKNGIHINLKGIAIGNGFTNLQIQYKAYADYALKMKIIGLEDYKKIKNNIVPICATSIKFCVAFGGEYCESTYKFCHIIVSRIMNISGVNQYDIRKKPYGGNFNPLLDLEKFLNQKCVRDALKVGKIHYASCSPDIIYAMRTELMRDLSIGTPALLENNIKVLIYAGEYDFICNWIGIEMWMHAMKWIGAEHFKNSRKRAFIVDGVKAGELKSYKSLTFLKVYKAGHLVPMDQPKVALEMLVRWISTGDISKSN